VEGVNSGMIYLIYCKNFCKCRNVPPPSTAIKKEKSCQLLGRQRPEDLGSSPSQAKTYCETLSNKRAKGLEVWLKQ
jgi:hypothetical protein